MYIKGFHFCANPDIVMHNKSEKIEERKKFKTSMYTVFFSII